MTHGGEGIGLVRPGGRLWPALAVVLLSGFFAPAFAQMFTDRPPPVPPAAVPDPGAAINLAPATGPASAPPTGGPPTGSPPPPPPPQPSMAAAPPVNAPQGAAAPGQAVLSLSARYGKDLA